MLLSGDLQTKLARKAHNTNNFFRAQWPILMCNGKIQIGLTCATGAFRNQC
jgi:hypothetical protein